MNVLLKELGSFKNGLNYSSDSSQKGIKLIGISNFGNKYIASYSNLSEVDEKIVSDDYLLQDGDILFVRSNGNKALVGRTMLIEDIKEKITYSGFCIRFRPDLTKVRPLFLLYLFKSPLFRKLLSNGQQTSITNLNQEVLGNLKVKLPSLSEQDKLVDAIHGITKKIENNNTVNDNLAKQLKTLYQYWFIQFEFPDESGMPYSSNQGEMEYNSRLKKKSPVGWKVQSIANNDLSTIIKPGVEQFTSKTYYPTSEVNGTAIGMGSTIDFETRESRANMQPTEYSVWFAKMKNSVKHLFLNPELKQIIDSSILSTGFSGLQCNEKSFEYISSVISSEYFETIKDTLAHGATQEAVNNDDLANIFFVIPDISTLEKYHVISEKMFSQISNNIIESRELTKLRDWLLPMLMNGQASIAN